MIPDRYLRRLHLLIPHWHKMELPETHSQWFSVLPHYWMKTLHPASVSCRYNSLPPLQHFLFLHPFHLHWYWRIPAYHGRDRPVMSPSTAPVLYKPDQSWLLLHRLPHPASSWQHLYQSWFLPQNLLRCNHFPDPVLHPPVLHKSDHIPDPDRHHCM